jgi:hypothetical protein
MKSIMLLTKCRIYSCKWFIVALSVFAIDRSTMVSVSVKKLAFMLQAGELHVLSNVTNKS